MGPTDFLWGSAWFPTCLGPLIQNAEFVGVPIACLRNGALGYDDGAEQRTAGDEYRVSSGLGQQHATRRRRAPVEESAGECRDVGGIMAVAPTLTREEVCWVGYAANVEEVLEETVASDGTPLQCVAV